MDGVHREEIYLRELEEMTDEQKLIAFSERAFRATRNPLHAFLAYQTARHTSAPVPEWVLEFFDSSLEAFVNDPKENLPKSFAKAFGVRVGNFADPKDWVAGFYRRPGRDGLYRLDRHDHWWLGIGFRALLLMIERAGIDAPLNESGAVDSIASRSGLSFASAWRCWARFKRAFPELAKLADRFSTKMQTRQSV
jgi:hypothetical protein